MKKISILIMVFTLLSLPAFADRLIYYPFDVKIGGQVATPTTGVVATIAQPVAADAELEVMLPEVKNPIFLNFFLSDEKGIVAQDNTQASEIIMINVGPKVLINQTMSKNPLKSGTTYLLNIMANSQTSRVVFKVK